MLEKPHRAQEWQMHLEEPLIRSGSITGGVCCCFHAHLCRQHRLPPIHLDMACLSGRRLGLEIWLSTRWTR